MKYTSPSYHFKSAVLVVTVLAAGAVQTEAQSFLFDFGSNVTVTTNGSAPADDPVNFWNNVTAAIGTSSTGVLPSVVTTTNEFSNLQLQMVSRFNAVNENGTPNSSLFPSDATRDSLFGNTESFGTPALSNVFPAFKLSGLDSTKAYSFTFYASRMLTPAPANEIRTTEYTVLGGISGNATLNVLNNVNNTVTVFGITPDNFGEILISLAPAADNNNGNHFTYLGVMRVDVVPEPSALLMLAGGVGVLATRRRRVLR